MEEKKIPRRIKRVKTHIEADTIPGLEHMGWFPAITPKGVTKILNGSGVERDFDDDKENLEDIDDAIQIRTYTLDDE